MLTDIYETLCRPHKAGCEAGSGLSCSTFVLREMIELCYPPGSHAPSTGRSTTSNLSVCQSVDWVTLDVHWVAMQDERIGGVQYGWWVSVNWIGGVQFGWGFE